jgi:3-oxoacyl-[acyl-carrier-protein] synthase-3
MTQNIAQRKFAKILGTGSYLPANRVTNADITAKLAKDGIETSDEWIFFS